MFVLRNKRKEMGEFQMKASPVNVHSPAEEASLFLPTNVQMTVIWALRCDTFLPISGG